MNKLILISIIIFSVITCRNVNEGKINKLPINESEILTENTNKKVNTDSIVLTNIINTLINYPSQSISGLIDFSENSNSELDSTFNNLIEIEEWMINYFFDEQLKDFYTCSTCKSYFYSIEKKSNDSFDIYILSTDHMTYRYLDCFNLSSNSNYVFTPSFKDGQPDYLARRYGEYINDSVYRCYDINMLIDFNPQRTITYYDSTSVIISLKDNGIEDTISSYVFLDTLYSE